MAKNRNSRGALGKNPPKPKVDPKAAAKKNRDDYLNTVRNLGQYPVGSPEYQAAVDKVTKLGKQLGYKDNRINTAISKYAQQGTPGAPAGSPESNFRRLGPDQQGQELGEDYRAYQNQLYANYMGTSPEQYMKNYEIGFQQERDKAYNDVVNQFERTNADQFNREDQAFQQQMLSQGIDPNSGYYQAQYKALKDSQNNQRLNAQYNASQQAYSVAKQAFEQGTKQYGLPAEMSQYVMAPGMLQYKTEQEAQMEKARNEAAIQQARISGGATTNAANINAKTQREIAYLEAAKAQDNQPRTVSPGNAFATGVANTAPGAVARTR